MNLPAVLCCKKCTKHMSKTGVQLEVYPKVFCCFFFEKLFLPIGFSILQSTSWVLRPMGLLLCSMAICCIFVGCRSRVTDRIEMCFFQYFVGVGLPLESVAVTEAIANGCIFLNPRFKGPASDILPRSDKPTSRKVVRCCVKMCSLFCQSRYTIA